MATKSGGKWVPPAETTKMYQAYTPDEDRARTNVHYEQPPAFFERITGGEWNVYSCNVWDGSNDETAAQERKLDLLAELLELRPGQRILDVGCGWGGPLVYLAKRYGVRGVGLTLSPTQKQAADARIARYGVDVQIVESHWKEFTDAEGFDAIYTDEVIVHFQDLGGYFRKVHELLLPGGRMLNKELHFVHPRYFAEATRAQAFINEIYGSTGNYRTLGEELSLAMDADFDVTRIEQLDRTHYQRTLDRWLSNMHEHQPELEDLVGAEHFRRFRTYLKIVRRVLAGTTMTIDIVVSRRPDAAVSA